MKSTSCSSGCAPSPWKWAVFHITRVFSVSSQYTIHRCLRHLHCLANLRCCIPRCFHPNDLPSLADGTFPHDEVKLTGHKKLTFLVTKVVLVSTLLFKDYMVIFTHFCQTCYRVYTLHIDNFLGSHSMSTTMKNKFGIFLQELFSRGVHWTMGCMCQCIFPTNLAPLEIRQPRGATRKYYLSRCGEITRKSNEKISCRTEIISCRSEIVSHHGEIKRYLAVANSYLNSAINIWYIAAATYYLMAETSYLATAC